MITPRAVHHDSLMGDSVFRVINQTVNSTATALPLIWIPDCDFIEVMELGQYLRTTDGTGNSGFRLVRQDTDDANLANVTKGFTLLSDMKDGDLPVRVFGAQPGLAMTTALQHYIFRPPRMKRRIEAVAQSFNTRRGLGLRFLWDMGTGTETHTVDAWVYYRVHRAA